MPEGANDLREAGNQQKQEKSAHGNNDHAERSRIHVGWMRGRGACHGLRMPEEADGSGAHAHGVNVRSPQHRGRASGGSVYG
jgi:hypothetical protein